MIGERLLELRKDADLTQDDLAKILNVNKHSISSYERDKSEPPDDIKIEIAKYFHVSVDYLLGITDVPVAIDADQMAMKLPNGFTTEMMTELKQYADFLVYKASLK